MKSILTALLLMSSLFGADANGKWSGYILIDEGGGNVKRAPLVVVLAVDGKRVTGTAGPDEANQKPITSSEIPREWLTFAVNSETRIDLLIKGDKATGYIAKEGQRGRYKLELTRQ